MAEGAGVAMREEVRHDVVKSDVVLYADDPAGAFSPTLNASRPTGGTEVHMVQLAEGLAQMGYHVLATSPIGDEYAMHEAESPAYLPSSRIVSWTSRALITAGLTKRPPWLETDRHVILWTHEPGHNLPHLEAAGLRWSEFVCVSHWQALRFPRGWKTRVIPPIIDDWIYALPPVEKNPRKWVSLSAAWKGLQQTLEAWTQIRPPGAELHVGSPYSHGPEARQMVERTPGCVWVPLDSPRAVVEAMRDAAAVFRVVMAPETFGVTDAIAQILNCRIHAYCPNGLGGMAEALLDLRYVTTDVSAFAEGVKSPGEAPIAFYNFRASRIIPMWRKLLDL